MDARDAGVGDTLRTQPLLAVGGRHLAAHGADVDGGRLERRDERGDVELLVVREHADGRALVDGRVPKETVGPLDDELVRFGKALRGHEGRPRIADGDAVAEELADPRERGGVVDRAEDVHRRPRGQRVDEQGLALDFGECAFAARE